MSALVLAPAPAHNNNNKRKSQQHNGNSGQTSPPPSVRKQHKKLQQKTLVQDITKHGSAPVEYHRKPSWGFHQKKPSVLQQHHHHQEAGRVATIQPDITPTASAAVLDFGSVTPVAPVASVVVGNPGCSSGFLLADKENTVAGVDYFDITADLEVLRTQMLEEEELERGEDLSYVIKSPANAAHDVVVYGLVEFGIESARSQYISFDGRKISGNESVSPCISEVLDHLLRGYFVRVIPRVPAIGSVYWIGLSLLNHCAAACLKYMKLQGITRLTKRLWMEHIVSEALKICTLPDNRPGGWTPPVVVAAAVTAPVSTPTSKM